MIQRSDRLALGLVVVVALAVRVAFLFRAPPFYVGGDSPTYLQPAVDLLLGAGFDPIAKRPPGYPLFVASTIAALGWDLQGLSFAQHLLGVSTAAAAWALARLTFGRLAGLVAGLMIALNGPLIIYEHFVMSESLFTLLTTLAVIATVWAARRPSVAAFMASGLLFGLASATRQTAQVLLILVPAAALLAGGSWRRALRVTALALLGFALVVVPWLAFDYARHQTLGSGTLGETLVWRLTRSGVEGEFFKWRPTPGPDQRLHEARRFALGQAADRVLPSDTKVAVQRRFGLDEAQADRLLRDLALEAIRLQPGLYLQTSFEIFGEHLVGTQQWLGGQGKEGGVTRYSDVQAKYGEWWSDELRPLILSPTAAQEREFRRALALSQIFQPYRYAWILLPMGMLGIAGALINPAWRLGLVPALAALLLLAQAAFLAGALPRYRYPADPLLAVVEAGGLTCLTALLAKLYQAVKRPASLQRPNLGTSPDTALSVPES